MPYTEVILTTQKDILLRCLFFVNQHIETELL